MPRWPQRKDHLNKHPTPAAVLWLSRVCCQLKGMPSPAHSGCGSPEGSATALVSLTRRARGRCTDPVPQWTCRTWQNKHVNLNFPVTSHRRFSLIFKNAQNRRKQRRHIPATKLQLLLLPSSFSNCAAHVFPDEMRAVGLLECQLVKRLETMFGKKES